MRLALTLAALGLLAACGTSTPAPQGPPVWGHAISGDLQISEGWVTSVDMGGMDMSSMPDMVMNMDTAAYLTITNSGQPDALISANTPAAVRVSFHRDVASANGSSATMVSVPAFEIPRHGTLRLAPGGDHIMLSGLKANFRIGDQIKLVLLFRSGRSATVMLPVINPSDRPGQE